MGDHFAGWCRPSAVYEGLRPNWAGVFLLIWPALATLVSSAETTVPARQDIPIANTSAADAHSNPVVAGDVVLQNGGVLHGVILADPSGPDRGNTVSGARIALVTEGVVVGQTMSDQTGRFTVSHLRGGKYLIRVTRKDGVDWRLYRVWTINGAPPKATSVAQIVLGRGIVRGQGPFPTVSATEAALVGGVAVGAVATPVIYHNAQTSNRVPASP